MLPFSSLLFHTIHASCYGYRKPIPIQGTNIKLDTPEALEQWIAERKKRFPTAERVAEKEQKLSEAIERGQLPVDDPRQPRQKRRRIEESSNVSARGRGRGRGRGADRGWRGRGGGVSGPGRCHWERASKLTSVVLSKYVFVEAANVSEMTD